MGEIEDSMKEKTQCAIAPNAVIAHNPSL